MGRIVSRKEKGYVCNNPKAQRGHGRRYGPAGSLPATAASSDAGKAKFRDLLVAVPAASVVAVDMPIGLPATARRADVEPAGWWEHDRQASSRPAAGSCRSRSLRGSQPTIRALIGQGISLQTFALAKKILEVESCRVGRRHASSGRVG
jgi:predicted RNase H-like nuclease